MPRVVFIDKIEPVQQHFLFRPFKVKAQFAISVEGILFCSFTDGYSMNDVGRFFVIPP